MAGRPTAWLPPATGWRWQPLRPDDLRLAYPLILIVERRDAAGWLAEAKGWLASAGRGGGIAGVRCGSGTLLGLFFHRISPATGAAHLRVERVRLLESVGPHRTLTAVLRACRELAEIHACRDVRILRDEAGASPSVEAMATVGARLGFAPDSDGWRLDLRAVGTIVPLRSDVRPEDP